MKDANMLWAAFIVYILPLIGILIGALIGTWIGGKLGHSLREFQIGGGVLFFILSLIYIKIFDRSTSKNESKKPVITKILY
ncbi:SoxR reducing system RseC family protein [Clostridium ljungdahlii]|uniref:SoxR reducing system RseC family protein n=1 Tax=Clostridium ljungdahlii TaxID=1538 RepID=UPI00386EF19B